MVTTHRRVGLPVLRVASCGTCRRHYPGGTPGCNVAAFQRRRPSPCINRVGFRSIIFEACSTFTRVTACTFAEPLNGPFHRRLRQLRYLHCRFDYYRLSDPCRVGLAPTENNRLSRRTYTDYAVLCTKLAMQGVKVGNFMGKDSPNPWARIATIGLTSKITG